MIENTHLHVYMAFKAPHCLQSGDAKLGSPRVLPSLAKDGNERKFIETGVWGGWLGRQLRVFKELWGGTSARPDGRAVLATDPLRLFFFSLLLPCCVQVRSFHMLLRSLVGREPTYFPVGKRGFRSGSDQMSAMPNDPIGDRTHHSSLHGTHIVTGVLGCEAITLGLACATSPDHLSLKEGWGMRLKARGQMSSFIVAQVPTEDPEVIWGWEREDQRIHMCGPGSVLLK